MNKDGAAFTVTEAFVAEGYEGTCTGSDSTGVTTSICNTAAAIAISGDGTVTATGMA